MTKRPSFQFYPGDWRADPKLRSISLAARGLWLELLCLMHEGEPYGHLTTHGIKGANPRQIGRVIAADPRTVASQLRTLIEYGIVSKTDTGTLYSKRMVEDEKRRLDTARRVSRHRGRRDVTSGVTGGVTPVKRPSSSSSSSSSTPHNSPPKGGESGSRESWKTVLDRDEYAPLRASGKFLAAWTAWVEHAAERGTKAKVPAGKQAATLLNRALRDVPAFVRAVESSIANDWRGINPEWNRDGGRPQKPDPISNAPSAETAYDAWYRVWDARETTRTAGSFLAERAVKEMGGWDAVVGDYRECRDRFVAAYEKCKGSAA